jgi:uncharacterized protein
MIKFETPAGNKYAWDDDVGLFIPLSPTMSAVLNEISDRQAICKEHIIARLESMFNVEEILFCYNWINKWKKIKSKNKNLQIYKNISASSIKHYILKTGLLQLTLGITEDCNFRCKYCVFSDNYEHSRTYSKKYMNFTTAKKAIDCYFSLLDTGKRYNPLRKPSFGFYGGEPLLNFKLIKKCVGYIETEYAKYQTRYNLTTNGSLLDEEKANWLMDHDFSISISLDGPENEHNRLRVYRNGSGTFQDVMRNINYLMSKNYTKVYSLPVFDWKSNLFLLDNFFNKDNIPTILNISVVNDTQGCRYYRQFTKEDYSNFLEQLKIAKDNYFSEIYIKKYKNKPSFFDKLIGQTPGKILFDAISIYPHHAIMPVTGACVPGRKLFVDVDGRFHACERINSSFPIGNVIDGLNYDKISNLMSEYIKQMDKCQVCNIRRRCRQCYQKFATNTGFSRSSEVCKGIESIRVAESIEAFTIAERNPEFVDETDTRYKNIKKYYGD